MFVEETEEFDGFVQKKLKNAIKAKRVCEKNFTNT